MRDATNTGNSEVVSPLVRELDFLNKLSPFAGRGWFERALEGLISPPTRWH